MGYRTKAKDIISWDFISDVATLSTFKNALERLVKEGSVKAKIIGTAIGEETYYMGA